MLTDTGALPLSIPAVILVRAVNGVCEAVDHIWTNGSGHTECIVADDQAAAETFLAAIDSAIVVHNTSTQLSDGGEFGMGAYSG